MRLTVPGFWKPLKFIAEYNGWKKNGFPRLTFKFRDMELTTLDTGGSTKKNPPTTA